MVNGGKRFRLTLRLSTDKVKFGLTSFVNTLIRDRKAKAIRENFIISHNRTNEEISFYLMLTFPEP